MAGAAHMVAEIADYAAFARGEQDAGPRLAPGDTETPTQRQATANAAQLARFTERDLTRLADALQVAAGVIALVPDYIDRQRAAGLHVSYELRFRGGPGT